MKITNLQDAEYLDWLYLHSPVGHLLEEHFDIKYCSGDDGTFMEINEINAKGYNEDTAIVPVHTIHPVPQWEPNEKQIF